MSGRSERNTPPIMSRGTALVLFVFSAGFTWLSHDWFLWAYSSDGDNPFVTIARIICFSGMVGGVIMVVFCAYSLWKAR